jgi:hypothetical protein
LANSGHAKLSSTINSNGQMGQPVNHDKYSFIDLPLDSEQQLKYLGSKMTVVKFDEQEKFVRNFNSL